jgi:twitching motility protein PilT
MNSLHPTAIEPLLQYLLAAGATDLHLAVGSVPRFRVDGQLVFAPEGEPVTAETLNAALESLLDESALAEFRRDRQLDFAFSWGDHARFRVNAFYQRGAPALAMRLIPHRIPTVEELGLPEICGRVVNRSHGLVLVTGPTGSGKSTTLAAMVDWINRHRAVHILTIEDPIEYLHTSSRALVNQREIGSDCVDFAAGMRSALREDPDVILVGELRDLDTMSLAITLAETGHLVFATLHTNDASQTIDRVIDSFPAEQQNQVRAQLGMSLAAVISQRLVPRIGGGRVAVFETLVATSAVSNLIREGKVRQLRNSIMTGGRDGMIVLEASINEQLARGVISLDDALAVSVHPEEVRPPGGLAPSAAYQQEYARR